MKEMHEVYAILYEILPYPSVSMKVLAIFMAFVGLFITCLMINSTVNAGSVSTGKSMIKKMRAKKTK